MTTAAIMQPTFLPWLGYLDLMEQVDAFVIYDDAQLSYQSWHHRNRIRTQAGLSWLTVPVARTSRFHALHEVRIADDDSFPQRLLNRFDEAYRAAPFKDLARGLMEPVARAAPKDGLVELNLALLAILRTSFGVETPITMATELKVDGDRSARLAAMCSSLGADEYITPPGALDYLVGDLHHFDEAGIRVFVHHYDHPTYAQVYEPFLSHASSLDALACLGPSAGSVLRTGRRAPLPVRDASELRDRIEGTQA
jgi:hypothetical protein